MSGPQPGIGITIIIKDLDMIKIPGGDASIERTHNIPHHRSASTISWMALDMTDPNNPVAADLTTLTGSPTLSLHRRFSDGVDTWEVFDVTPIDLTMSENDIVDSAEFGTSFNTLTSFEFVHRTTTHKQFHSIELELDTDVVDLDFNCTIWNHDGTILHSKHQEQDLWDAYKVGDCPFKISSDGLLLTIPLSQPFPFVANQPILVRYEFKEPI